MRGVLIRTLSGAQILLGLVARIAFRMIRDEDGALTGYIYIELKNTDYGGFVREANKRLQKPALLRATPIIGPASTNLS